MGTSAGSFNIYLAPHETWKKESKTKKTNMGTSAGSFNIYLAPHETWKKETKIK